MSSNAYQSKNSWNPSYQGNKTHQNNSNNSLPIQTKLDNESENLANNSEYKSLPSNSIINNFQKSSSLGNNYLAPLQAKLTIGAPGDQYEQEADQVAAQVVQKMNAPATPNDDNNNNSIQRKINISTLQRVEDQEEQLQAKFNFQVPNIQADFESTLNTAKSGGSPLDNAFRAKIEPEMGADFSGVRVHNDSTAHDLSQSIQAKAFTTGNHIFMKQGEYNPSSRSGQELLAHELTHVVQQGQSQQIQRKTVNIYNLDPTTVTVQKIGTSLTEDIRNSINKYNQIPLDDVNYDNQIQILTEILSDIEKWHKKHQNDKRDNVLSLKIVDINRAKDAVQQEINKVTQARKDATNTALGNKNQTRNAPANNKFEELTNEEIDGFFIPIEQMIKGEVVNKLGVGRGEWRRSKELNQFRQSLKDAAREQANVDIGTELTTQGKTGAMAEYQRMKANVETYSTAKGSVDRQMQELATTITAKFVQKGNYQQLLNAEATKATNDIAITLISKDPDLSQSNSLEKIKKAKLNAAKTKAAQLSEQHLDQAIAEARSITKGNQTQTVLDPNSSESLTKKVQEQVTTDEIGKKAVQKVIETDRLDEGFKIITGLIDANAPSPGTSVSLNITLKVRDPYTGAYFISQFMGEASKEQEDPNEPMEVSVRSEFSLGGGWERFGLDVNAQVGFYFESSAVNTHKAISLISYGLYRTLQTKDLDSTVANAIWGYGGKSQLKDKGLEAETWATAMEDYLFSTKDAQGNKTGVDETSKVEVGGLLKGGVKANLGFATGELEAKVSHGKQYSAKSMGFDNVSKVGTFKQRGSTELETASAGKNVTYLEIQAAMEAMQEFAGGEAGVKFGWDSVNGFSSFEIEAAGFLSSALAKGGKDYGTVMNHVCKAIAGYVTSLAAVGKKAYNTAKAKTNTQKGGEIVGIFSDLGNVAVTIGDHVGQEWGSQIVNVAGEEVGKDFLKSTADNLQWSPLLDIKQQLKLGGSFSWEKEGSEKKLKVYLSQVKALGVDTGSLLGEVFRLKIEGETTNEIFSKTFNL